MVQRQSRYSIDEIADRGAELYETRIRRLVESANVDRLVGIDVETGNHAVADERHVAAGALFEMNPDAQIWFIRIGHVATASFGGGDTREKK